MAFGNNCEKQQFRPKHTDPKHTDPKPKPKPKMLSFGQLINLSISDKTSQIGVYLFKGVLKSLQT